MRQLAWFLFGLILPTLALAGGSGGRLAVVVDELESREYVQHGTTYVEALRGREYSLRLTNPTGHRVAVALSVDGLNTIDARHSDALSASKWVLDPWETIEISGWQVSDRAARRFYFTTEGDSYGAKLGNIENLGVIEAVFFRERERPIAQYDHRHRRESQQEGAAAPAPPAKADASRPDDDYAATGMGDRTRHDVRRVSIDLDPHPIAKARIRYEFRPQLVKLGILRPDPSPLTRRERARGFDEYCPEHR